MFDYLAKYAREARKNAYCPYSDFAVGAAVLSESGKIYAGANCENASFGAGTCAERAALFAATSHGERKFTAVAVCGGKQGEASEECFPCGICLQALSEFMSPDAKILLCAEDGYSVHEFGEFMPKTFSLNK